MLNSHGKFVNARDVFGQLDLQHTVPGIVRPADARRDGRPVTADRPKLKAFALVLQHGRNVGDYHEPRLLHTVPVRFGDRLGLPLRIAHRHDANGGIHHQVERRGLLVDFLLERGGLQRLPFELLTHLIGSLQHLVLLVREFPIGRAQRLEIVLLFVVPDAKLVQFLGLRFDAGGEVHEAALLRVALAEKIVIGIRHRL